MIKINNTQNTLKNKEYIDKKNQIIWASTANKKELGERGEVGRG